jgi:hypothetical protein
MIFFIRAFDYLIIFHIWQRGITQANPNLSPTALITTVSQQAAHSMPAVPEDGAKAQSSQTHDVDAGQVCSPQTTRLGF